MSAFEDFVNLELPRRSAFLTVAIAGFDGDPNDVGAPDILKNAPVGTWYLQETGGPIEHRKLTASATGWVASAGGGVTIFATEIGLLASTPDNGDISYAEDTDRFFFRKNGAFVARGQFVATDTVTSVGAGLNSERYGFAASAAGAEALASGNAASADGVSSTALGGNATADGANSTAVGSNASTGAAAASTAVGRNATASASSAVAIGEGAIATGVNGVIAVGKDAQASGSQAVALGNNSFAGQSEGVAVGQGARANNLRCTAVGRNAIANGSDSVAVGQLSGSGFESVSLGKSANGSGSRSVAVGKNANTGAFANAIAIGKDAAAGGANDGQWGATGTPVDFRTYRQLAIGRVGVAVNTDTATSPQAIIGVTNTAAPRTVTLQTATLLSGRTIIVKDESGLAGTNNITVATQGAETIDGAATFVINTNYGLVRLYSDGTNWFTF